MSNKTDKIHLQIRYKDTTQELSAAPQEAWIFLMQFFKNMIPTYEIAQKLWLNVDIVQLSRDLEGVVVFSDDGTSLCTPKNKLTDCESLLIWLAAHYLGQQLGLVKEAFLSKDELQTKLGKSGKITSTRLGELIKSGMAVKENEDRFRITTFGVLRVQKEVIPKLKSQHSGS